MTQLVTVEANNLLDGVLGTASFTATTAPLKCRLMTVNGTATAAGTQVSGGSYAALTVTFAAASGQSAATSADLVFTAMPACTVVGIELWDSAGTPLRKAFGPLTASKTLLSGDTLTISAGQLTVSWA